MEERWAPGIGDPSVMGWVTVAAYFLVAICCLLVRLIEPLDDNKHSANYQTYRRFWWTLAIFLVLMGINKQLDLQSLFTQIGRDFAKSAGWYAHRRLVQTLFITGIGIGGVVICAYLVYRFRNACNTIKTALCGFCILVGFVVMRAASFHDFDYLLRYQIGGLRFNWIMELGTLIIIGAAALRYRKNYI